MLSESVIVCRNFKKISRRDCPLGRFDELKISSNYAFIVYWLQAVLSYGVDVYMDFAFTGSEPGVRLQCSLDGIVLDFSGV